MRRRSIIGAAAALLAGLAAFLLIVRDEGKVKTLVVGQYPTLIAADDRTGRAYVLDDGSLASDGGGGVVAGAIQVLDTRSGTFLHAVPAGTAPTDIAIDQRTGRVFVLNSYMHNGGQGTVTVLDARSGRIVHTAQVGDLPMALALDAGAGRVFVLNVANGVHVLHAHYALVSVLDAAGGLLIGGFNPAPGDGSQAGAGSLAFDSLRHRLVLPVSGPTNRVRLEAFDMRTDAPAWALPLGVNQGAGAVCVPATGRTFVFLDKRVVVLDTRTGRLVRTIHHPIYGWPVVDARTRRLIVVEQDWSSAARAPNWGRTDTGHLTILDAGTGVPLQMVPIAWPDGAAVDERTGRLLISHAGTKLSDSEFAGSGSVDLRDGSTGRLLHTFAVSVGPGAIAVDERSGRALVVNQGGQVPRRDPWGWLPDWLRGRVPLFPSPPGPTRTIPPGVSFIDL